MPHLQPEAYFTNLRDGAVIETPYRVAFGLSGGWGLGPIASVGQGKHGHHHLLVNIDLPVDLSKPLPFNDQYMHFGKGQMELVANWKPGTYRLRLLLADQKHHLHFVYSKPITVTVSKKNDTIDSQLMPMKSVTLPNLASNAEVSSPFKVQFHASGHNIGQQVQNLPETGHFKLSILPRSGGKAAEIALVNGATEVWLAPPVGIYDFQLSLIDNTNASRVLGSAKSEGVRVR